MKLPILPTDGKVDLSTVRFLLFGPPKIGKTTVLSGFPHTLFLATEKGYSALKIFKVDIPSWKDFVSAVDLIVAGRHAYKTIAIDTADVLFNLCVEHVCDELDIEHPSDEDWGKGYDIIGKTFEREMNRLFMSDYGLVMTSHVKTAEITTRGGRILKIVPTLAKRAHQILLPKVDLIGYMYQKTMKVGDNQYKEKRVISFKPTEYIEAGDRHGKMPEEIATFKDGKKTYAVFQNCYTSTNKEVLHGVR